jgi:hypothetical protein
MNFNSPTQLLAFKIWYPTLGGTATKETETPCDSRSKVH